MAPARQHSTWLAASAASLVLLTPLAGSAEGQQPLSVIDWLESREGTAPAVQVALPAPDEPPVAKTADTPKIKVATLDTAGPREIGLVPPQVTGLPADLWAGSDATRLRQLIDEMPDLTLPAAQSLFYTLLLAEAQAPGNDSAAGDALVLTRVRKLMQRGAVDPAQSLLEQAGAGSSAAHFDLWMQISLLTGTEDRACRMLTDMPRLSDDYGTNIFCSARAGRWEDAALTFGSARALALLPPEKLALLERFLDPEAFEGEPPLPPPAKMDPLSFRLHETIGEPLPTGNLPRAYAVADLRDIAGWKAQLTAAERLTRAGALPDNRLLGLYSARRASASGGVWDRVIGLKRFEAALQTGSADAIAKTLPTVWRAMKGAGLGHFFASLFARQLAEAPLNATTRPLANRILLLSPEYEQAASTMDKDDLAAQIARGEAGPGRPADLLQAAVHDGFAGAAPRADLTAMVRQGRLGESILLALALLDDGARGNAPALTDALATLRALGLEDTARRAALQVLLLGT